MTIRLLTYFENESQYLEVAQDQPEPQEGIQELNKVVCSICTNAFKNESFLAHKTDNGLFHFPVHIECQNNWYKMNPGLVARCHLCGEETSKTVIDLNNKVVKIWDNSLIPGEISEILGREIVMETPFHLLGITAVGATMGSATAIAITGQSAGGIVSSVITTIALGIFGSIAKAPESGNIGTAVSAIGLFATMAISPSIGSIGGFTEMVGAASGACLGIITGIGIKFLCDVGTGKFVVFRP